MAFVVSSGSLQAIEKSAPAVPMYSMRMSGGQSSEYAALYRAQPELRTVIDFLARNIGQLGLHVFERVTDVDRRRLADHPLAALLNRPNASTTRFRLFAGTVADRCIFDDAYWLKVRDDSGQPFALRRIRPQRITPTGANWLEPERYDIRGNRGTLTVDASDVVHFRGYNSDDDRIGSSPIESLRHILSEEWAANNYREQLWRNGARMAGYIKRPKDAPEWTEKGKGRFRSEWQAQYAGDGPRAGGTPILEDGMEFVAASTSPRDAQYVESRKLTREEVARSYHVPLPMVGILDHATFSNIKEQHKQLYADCLGPWLESMQEEIELQLLPDLADPAQVYVEFNIAEKLRGSFEEQATQLQQAVGAPWMTRNEARARVNLPQVEGGDELIVPLNVATGAQQQVDNTSTETPVEPAKTRVRQGIKARAPQQHADKTNDVLSKFFTRQGAAIASALGAKARTFSTKASADELFDAERWNGELAADLLLVTSSTAKAAASAAIEAMGLDPDDFDPDVMSAWLAAHADGTAQVMNEVTAASLADALDDDDPQTAVKTLFEGYATARAAQLATSLTSAMSGFGSVEAGKHAGGEGTTKTWVTGGNPRPEHAALNGETVDIEDTFSNGARWPADSTLAVDDIAGCNCDLVITAP